MKEKRKTRTGTVISDKMDKTVVVLVESLRRHTLYKKVIKKTSKFKVHDATNTCKVGDVVRIVETRPLSKDKRWRVVEVIGRKEVAEKEPAEII
ncbi:MAG: 30S ribosomal protein S17 [Dehalococcoidia bacterium]|nr:30S ribosomal protein S17 [Dehalococcoidia bacterium]